MTTTDSPRPYRVVCADGSPHRDYGVGPIIEAVNERAARDAAEFMDDERDSSPWECGPHSVVPNAPAHEPRRKTSTATPDVSTVPDALQLSDNDRSRQSANRRGCAQEMCGNWAGDGDVCPCALFDIDPEDRPIEETNHA